MTNRSRYSTAPTYGMQKRPAPKKQAAPAAPVFPPAGPPPQGPYGQTMMPGYGQPGGMPPQAAAYMPPQPAYAAQPAGFAQQPGYPPRQPGFQPPPVKQAAVPMQQPVPYYPQQPYVQQPVPQEYAVRPKARYGDNWLQILMLAVLPVLFVLTLLVSAPFLKIAFVGLGVLGLIAMWMQRAFVPSARATLTLVYGALILVCAVSLITGSTPRDKTTSAPGNGANTGKQQAGAAPVQSPENMVQMGGDTIQTTPGPTPTIAPESGENSPAWQSLSQFFNYWLVSNVPNMLDLVSPTWKAAQEKPETALYMAMSNRLPLDYSFEKISNTEADSTRTITMTATIDKRNGRSPVKIRFQILMLKFEGGWYVDPESLTSNDVADDTSGTSETGGGGGESTSATATPKPAGTPEPKTKLWFNDDGGEFYHADAECKKVAEKYLPLSPFYYKDLNTTKFKNLRPCPYCQAPDRP